MSHARTALATSLPVYLARTFTCTDGANMGDSLSFADELTLDDIYELPLSAETARLSVLPGGKARFVVADESPLGTPGAALHLDSALMFMSPDGATQEVLLLVEVDETGSATEIYLLPLAALIPQVEYRLVGIDTDEAHLKFAQVACVSFTRGTHITLASGAQCPVEDLKPGDRVLTRDDGVQQVRWIGQTTVRAVGEFAPIRVHAGALNNSQDLLVSPDHRLFIYQRQDAIGAGRSELLVKARHLVNGYTVTRSEGGFVDYFQLLFDSHQIIYAEGIAAETMLIDTRTRPVLPEEITQALGDVIPGHSDQPHAGLDVSEALLAHPDPAALLRKASTR
ncbi:MAG: Hint domain-containing protein [Sulfitobacter sp.]|nr:Hint domain-containing protein [Sulfitobacter sp.]